ncbi:MAG: hypothetical protein ABH834_01215 [Candidatus Altiarchaeota archaeon]
MKDKKYFRCTVCNDIHYGMSGPLLCPTCRVENAYVEVDLNEARKVMGL